MRRKLKQLGNSTLQRGVFWRGVCLSYNYEPYSNSSVLVSIFTVLFSGCGCAFSIYFWFVVFFFFHRTCVINDIVLIVQISWSLSCDHGLRRL